MSLDLTGQYALITGGTRGIGKAVALRLAGAGARVALSYLRNRAAAEATAAEMVALGAPPPLLLRGNVGEPDKVAALMAEVAAEFGQLDILISNAASGVLKPGLELTRRHLTWTMEINAYALLDLVQQAAPLMPSGGRILALSSAGATRAIPHYAAVGASKAALESLVRHLAQELAPRGLRINTLSAGVVDTDALTHFPNRSELLGEALQRTPVGRLVTPADVADVALLLCSPLAAMIQGQTIVVDGGNGILA